MPHAGPLRARDEGDDQRRELSPESHSGIGRDPFPGCSRARSRNASCPTRRFKAARLATRRGLNAGAVGNGIVSSAAMRAVPSTGAAACRSSSHWRERAIATPSLRSRRRKSTPCMPLPSGSSGTPNGRLTPRRKPCSMRGGNCRAFATHRGLMAGAEECGIEPKLFLIRPDGGSPRSISMNGCDAQWTLDGRLVSSGHRTESGLPIWIMDADGEGPRAVDATGSALTAAGYVLCPVWHPERLVSAMALWQPIPDTEP